MIGRPGRNAVSSINQQVSTANLAKTSIDNNGKKCLLTNQNNVGSPKENAASTGMDHDVKSLEKTTKVRKNNSPKSGKSAMSKLAKTEHKRSARMFGYALAFGELFGWKAATAVWAARLSNKERAALAFSALASLDHDEAVFTARMCLGESPGPLPAFLGGMDEARFWAANATPVERKAYALAAFEALSKTQKTAFRSYVFGKGFA